MFPSKLFSGLLTDLYELTMAAGYVQNRFNDRATFELFVRHLPRNRNYLVAAGLEQALDYLENVHFPPDEISYLRTLPIFRHVQTSFYDFLATFRFSGDVWAMPEGTIFFAGEPVVRVTAPIAEAELAETSLLSIIHLQTFIASKTARVTTAAAGRPVIEFGSRRAHGVEAGVLAARAALIAGCAGTSNTYAGHCHGVPAYGTQAHSWIMAHDDESTTFRKFLDVFPEQATLLVDTYDVRAAIDKTTPWDANPVGCASTVVTYWPIVSGLGSGLIVLAGRMCKFSSRVTSMKIALRHFSQATPIDSFGVRTALSTSADAPNVEVIYKLVEVELDHQVRGMAKFSVDNKTYPGRKQVFYFQGENGHYSGNTIALEDEDFPLAKSLLIPVMRDGHRLEVACQDPVSSVRNAQARFLAARAHLPEHILRIVTAEPIYPVSYSAGLESLPEQARNSFLSTASV